MNERLFPTLIFCHCNVQVCKSWGVGRLHHGVSVMVSELVYAYIAMIWDSWRPEEALTLAANCHPARGVRLDAARNGLPDAGVAGDVPSLPETFSSLPVLTRTSRSRRTVRAGYACGLLRADAPEAQGNLPHTTVRPPYAYQPRPCRTYRVPASGVPYVPRTVAPQVAADGATLLRAAAWSNCSLGCAPARLKRLLRGAPGGSGRLGAPRGEAGPLGAQPK